MPVPTRFKQRKRKVEMQSSVEEMGRGAGREILIEEEGLAGTFI